MRNLKTKDMKNFKIELLTSEIDDGLWEKISSNAYEDEEIENHEDIENIDARITINEANFETVFDKDRILQIFEGRLDQDENLYSYLDELFCCYITILIMQNKNKDAVD